MRPGATYPRKFPDRSRRDGFSAQAANGTVSFLRESHGISHIGATLTLTLDGVSVTEKVTVPETSAIAMTRTIPPSLSGILEELELEQPALVTSEQIARLVEQQGLRTPARIVAARLRERGWLLPTGRRGVWEFAPAALAGALSRSDPLTPVRAFLLQRPDARCALTFQSAAWTHGIADRAPARVELAAATAGLARQLPAGLAVSVFEPRLDPDALRDVPVLATESILVHMATSPRAVRSWASALEWLPDLAAEVSWKRLSVELADRPVTVRARAGYLVQGLRPDLAGRIRDLGPPHGKTWFGPRGSLRRHDNVWQIADTILPFDPRNLSSVV